MTRNEISESVQRLAARLLATNSAGVGLCLIGGFRLRLLDGSARRSLDLDYHWDKDLKSKQSEVEKLLRVKLLPDVKSRFGLDGDVRTSAESPFVRTVEVAFYKVGSDLGRIEIPVDITRIPCLDKPVVRTIDGVVYLAASDADVLEGKLLALVLREHVVARDLVDIFLFRDRVSADVIVRLKKKLAKVKASRDQVGERLRRISSDRVLHIRNITTILREQVEPAIAANLIAAGGADMIFDEVTPIISRAFGVEAAK